MMTIAYYKINEFPFLFQTFHINDEFLLFDKNLTGICRACKLISSSERVLTVCACLLCRHSETT